MVHSLQRRKRRTFQEIDCVAEMQIIKENADHKLRIDLERNSLDKDRLSLEKKRYELEKKTGGKSMEVQNLTVESHIALASTIKFMADAVKDKKGEI